MSRKLVSVGLVSLLFAVLLVCCGQNNEQSSSNTSKEVVTMNVKKVTLDVQGMTCSGCEHAVESALKKIDGVAKAKADFTHDMAEVQFDPDIISVEQLVDAVNGTGFSAKATN